MSASFIRSFLLGVVLSPACLAAQSASDTSARKQAAPADTTKPAPPAEPFAFGDWAWMNGNNRQSKSVLETPYFTPTVMMDVYYAYNFNRPIDNTVVGSTAIGRSNEFQVALATIGGDFHAGNARGTLTLQFGDRTILVPRNDGTVLRGQYDLTTALRYIREATAGYHFDVMHGFNVDAGIFMSYIGLASNLNHENWMYMPSYVSDNTPFFFQGVRLQLFPTDRLKIEGWITNGWQSYSKYNDGVGLGSQINWRPTTNLNFVTNNYYGYETRGAANRVRIHTDDSFLIRYLEKPKSTGITRSAFSVTADLGCEDGDGVTCGSQYFAGIMAYNRVWFAANKLAWTVGGGYVTNPGRYLVLFPPGPVPFDGSPGTSFKASDFSTTFDFMPDDFFTLRTEFSYRHANVPFFAGRGGTTSPTGYADTPIPPGWQPDRVKNQSMLIVSTIVRF
jgi:hypothetical protein